jgi:hypothetical protein
MFDDTDLSKRLAFALCTLTVLRGLIGDDQALDVSGVGSRTTKRAPPPVRSSTVITPP